MPDKVREPFTFVIFGGTGDLSRSKLLPALYHLADLGYLPDKYAVIGSARSPLDDESYRKLAREAIEEHQREERAAANPSKLLESLYYVRGDTTKPETFAHLKQRLDKFPGNRLFYLAVAPNLAAGIVQNLDGAGLIHKRGAGAWTRIIFEKPFGQDLESAAALNAEIKKILSEDQIFRIDHYLGKETVQNILTFRFGNSIFEPLFNRSHVGRIRITIAEAGGVDGRGPYYDSAGALRDIIQNHALQLLCLTAMEPPASFDAEAIRDEKVKVLRALPRMSAKEAAESTVRGQYKGYRNEEGIKPDSLTETFVALRTNIDNWRWSGVPIVIQTGKRLRERETDIEIQFNQPPLCLFQEFGDCPPDPNWLTLRIQPNEGIHLSFVAKQPGTRYAAQNVNMDFSYAKSFERRSPEAYERLLLDALLGDPSLFIRSDEVEMAWRFISAIHEGWQKLPPPVFPNYDPESLGPAEANRLLNSSQIRRQ